MDTSFGDFVEMMFALAGVLGLVLFAIEYLGKKNAPDSKYVDIGVFLQDPQRYKGQRLQTHFKYSRIPSMSAARAAAMVSDNQSYEVKIAIDPTLTGRQEDVALLIPTTVDVSAADRETFLWITFDCMEGTLESGNHVVSVGSVPPES